MDRYQKVEQPRQESAISENEIRITSQGVIRNYVSYATSLLQDKLVREIVLKAMGQAISKAVAVAEIIKKRNRGLYQDTAISSVSITDVWEPIEEGLVPLETTRHVSMISISLSARELNKNSPGYQVPLEQPRRQPRYQQPQQQLQFKIKQERNQFNEDSYARGHIRGRGRGRGGRSWGRGYGRYEYDQGGYDNYQRGYGEYDYNQGGYGYNQGGYHYNQGAYHYNQENGAWNSNWGRGGRRGRGEWTYYGGGYSGGRGSSGRTGGRGYSRGRGRMGRHG